MNSPRQSTLILLVVALFLGLSAPQSEAAVILIFGDRSNDRANLAADLIGLGHTVTNQAALPGDLSGFDTIWHVGAFVPLSGSDQGQLAGFLAGGGGIHLTGERPCCETLNDSLETFVNGVVVGGGISVGDQGDIGGPYPFNAGAVGGVGTNPNALANWNPSAPGGMAGISGANILVSGAGGVPVGGAWDSSDLVGNSGRLTLLMDVNWFSNSGSVDDVENIQLFLEGGGIGRVPLPGVTSLLAIGLFAMAGARRRGGNRVG